MRIGENSDFQGNRTAFLGFVLFCYTYYIIPSLFCKKRLIRSKRRLPFRASGAHRSKAKSTSQEVLFVLNVMVLKDTFPYFVNCKLFVLTYRPKFIFIRRIICQQRLNYGLSIMLFCPYIVEMLLS